MDWTEGAEYDLEDKERWEALVVGRGEVVEIHLPSTNLGCLADIWAGFWVKQVIMLETGDYALIAGSLGCTDPDWSRYLSNQFNRRRGRIHLCSSKPCASTKEFHLHVTRLRTWTVEGFHRSYMSSYTRRQVEKWEQEEPEELKTEALDLSNEKVGEDEEEPPEEERAKEVRRDKKDKKEAKRDTKAVLTPGKDEEKERLRQWLDAARANMVAGRVAPPKEEDEEDGKSGEESSAQSSKRGYSPSVLEELENGGGALKKIDPPERGNKTQKEKAKKQKKRPEEEKNKGGRRKRDSPSGSRSRKKRKSTFEVDSKDGHTKTLQSQLVLRAAATAKQNEEKAQEVKRKHQKKNPGHQLAKILTRVAQGDKGPGRGRDRSESSGKKKKKKKKSAKKKRQRRRQRGDPDGSPNGSSSPISSYETDSQASWEEASTSSEGRRLEAPLKRKAKEKPGSVLQLLVEHARSQLDQSSKVGIGSKEEVTVTSGVKLSSYFAIIVKPQMGNSLAQARECHHLATAMDLLRQGELSLLGDTLAGRFLSLHQSVIDGSWTTARHLELFPMQDGTAAGPEVILSAKKHAKLAARLSGNESWSWGGTGKAKGGRGRGVPWQESYGEGKGKTKKGAKGKGKSKGVVLAWWLVRSHAGTLEKGITKEFMAPWVGMIAKSKLASKRMRGATFPIRLGELLGLEEVLTVCALVDITVEPMLSLWAHQAWAYVSISALNRLAGSGARLQPGHWTVSEEAAYRSILGAAERRCSRDAEDLSLSEEAWEKEMRSKQVGYNGEEISICHELTWEQVKDIRSITKKTVQEWSLKFLQIQEVHVWGGWPCVDLSAVRHGRLNLAGPQSSLFWEIPRVVDLIKSEFGPSVQFKQVLENVASMDESAAREISYEMQCLPYRLDSVDAVPMRRPRFCWTTEAIEGVFPDVVVSPKRYWREVTAEAPYPATEQWLTPGYEWEGGHFGHVFPTCMKSIPRTSPPPKPAGLEKTDFATRQRVSASSWAYRPIILGRTVYAEEMAWDEVKAREIRQGQRARAAKEFATATPPAPAQAAAVNTNIAPAEEVWGGDLYEFKIQYFTNFGEEMYLVGSADELGAWDLSRKVHMAWTKDNFWTVKVQIPADRKAVEYKFIVGQNGNNRWEGGQNHRFELTGGRCVLSVWEQGSTAIF
eukprot:s731_g22.t1